jgi:metacaspase-1
MFGIAQAQGFSSTLVKTRKATRRNVIHSIQKSAEVLEPGDLFFLTYAGHGGQICDVNKDEAEGLDETWVLYDGELIDDELNLLWSKFHAGVRILVISDSCHSGSIFKCLGRNDVRLNRFDGLKYRFMPSDIAIMTYRKNQSFYDRIQRDIPVDIPIQASILLISGCQDDELAADGVSNGLFTEKLLSAWNDGRFEGNYPDLHRTITQSIPPKFRQHPNYSVLGKANPGFEGQKPFMI